MSIESLEHIMRSRVRMIVRHTWLLAILGTVIVVGLVWVGFYISTEAERMRIAAGPTDAKFIQALSDQIVQSHRNLHLKFVPAASSQDAANAIRDGKADLAILPSTADSSLKWPVVAILRQNVMALIVPPSASAKTARPRRRA